MARISVPTAARLPSSLRLGASNATALKLLGRLSRSSLITLALDWLSDDNEALSEPYLRGEEEDDEEDSDDFYPPARSLEELREVYNQLEARKGSKREVLDRILEGDWRHGLSLYQLAMADLQHLHDHPTSQKWSAYRIVPLQKVSTDADANEPAKVDKESLVIPRFHPSTFVQNLQAHVLPDVKAHYNFDRPKGLPLLLLRIFILDSPYNTSLAVSSGSGDRLAASFESSRTIFIAFPDASPYIYISRSQVVGAVSTGETKSLRSLIIEGIPKALSRPRERYTLKSTNLTTRNMHELLYRRGAGRTNTAGGGWSVYSDENKKESPLDTLLPTPPLSETDDVQKPGTEPRKRAVSPETEKEERATKRARLAAQARFGDSGRIDDGKGVERVDIVMEDPYPEGSSSVANIDEDQGQEEGEDSGLAAGRRREKGGRRSDIDIALDREAASHEEDDIEPETWKPDIRLTFHGPHVFAGMRQLVEAGVIDGKRMPGWLTGEEGVTVGAVKHGRIRGHKGSGI